MCVFKEARFVAVCFVCCWFSHLLLLVVISYLVHYDISLSVSTAIFPGEPQLAGFIEAKGDVGGGDNWSYKSCKAPVKSSPPTNQRGVRHPCCEETRTWCYRHQLILTYLEPVGTVKAPGTPRRQPADEIPDVADLLPHCSLVFDRAIRLKPLFCGCCQTSSKLSTVVTRPPWSF